MDSKTENIALAEAKAAMANELEKHKDLIKIWANSKDYAEKLQTAGSLAHADNQAAINLTATIRQRSHEDNMKEEIIGSSGSVVVRLLRLKDAKGSMEYFQALDKFEGDAAPFSPDMMSSQPKTLTALKAYLVVVGVQAALGRLEGRGSNFSSWGQGLV